MRAEPVKCGCGGEAKIQFTESGLIYVECESCLTATRFCSTENEAVRIWNKAMKKG